MAICVNFRMKERGFHALRALTTKFFSNAQAGFHRRIGIVMDEQLLSAPRILAAISDRGQITGEITQEEVMLLVRVLRAGCGD